MTAPQSPRKHAYQPHQSHGLNALKKTLKQVGEDHNWMANLGEVGKELQDWQAALIHDLGGEANLSAMQRSVVELATRTHLLLSSIDRWLLEQPSLIHKSKRQLFPVVLQRQQLADALARYMNQLGLEKRVNSVPDLRTYLHDTST